MQEHFKDIPGYPGYQISSNGTVISYKKGKVISLSPDISKAQHTTYHRVTLCRNGVTKKFLVHRLVAELYVPNPENKPHVNHLDNNGTNNDYRNLEWCTPTENMQHSVKQGRQLIAQSAATSMATVVNNDRYAKTYEERFGNRFVAYFNSIQINENDALAKPAAAIIYICSSCNVERLASVQWAEITKHNGVCPNCTTKITLKTFT